MIMNTFTITAAFILLNAANIVSATDTSTDKAALLAFKAANVHTDVTVDGRTKDWLESWSDANDPCHADCWDATTYTTDSEHTRPAGDTAAGKCFAHVFCNAPSPNGRVIVLDLHSNHAVCGSHTCTYYDWKLTASVDHLAPITAMRFLSLRSVGALVTGDVGTAFAAMTELRYLNLRATKVHGDIASLATLTSLGEKAPGCRMDVVWGGVGCSTTSSNCISYCESTADFYRASSSGDPAWQSDATPALDIMETRIQGDLTVLFRALGSTPTADDPDNIPQDGRRNRWGILAQTPNAQWSKCGGPLPDVSNTDPATGVEYGRAESPGMKMSCVGQGLVERKKTAWGLWVGTSTCACCTGAPAPSVNGGLCPSECELRRRKLKPTRSRSNFFFPLPFFFLLSSFFFLSFFFLSSFFFLLLSVLNLRLRSSCSPLSLLHQLIPSTLPMPIKLPAPASACAPNVTTAAATATPAHPVHAAQPATED